MHAREKTFSPNVKKWQKKHPQQIDPGCVLEHQQVLLDPACSDIRAQWLNQELSELDRKPKTITDSLKNYTQELLAFCLEDIKSISVPLLAGQYIIKLAVWSGCSSFIEGYIEKLLVMRVCDPLCSFQLRESAVMVLTVLHCLDIIKTPDSYYPDLEIAPNNHAISSNKYLESFFNILTELIKSASLNLQSDVIEESTIEEMDENTNEESEESLDSKSYDDNSLSDLDPKDSLLECIIQSWCALVCLVSDEIFDREFPEAYEIFNRFVKYHNNEAIKIVACEAIITLSDLNERMPLDKQYEIEIQPLVDRLLKYANESDSSHKSKVIWSNISKALEAEKCVVELPFISFQHKTLSGMTKYQSDMKRLNQNRAKRETLWTNWSEAITVKYIKNTLGHLFNELMQHNIQFGSKILSLLENKDSWHLSCQNVPFSMVYVRMINSPTGVSPKRYNDLKSEYDKSYSKFSNDWSKKNDKSELNNMVKYGLYLK